MDVRPAPESGRTQIWDDRPNPAEKHIKHDRNQSFGQILYVLGSKFVNLIFIIFGLRNHLQLKNMFFGRIRAVVPNLSSAGFGRPSQI